MRIRKRKAQETGHQPASSSEAALQRKDHNERGQIGSKGPELVVRHGGEAAALSLVLLAAESLPNIAQEYKTRQKELRKRHSHLRAEDGVPKSRADKVDSMARKDKLGRVSNSKTASRQFASGKTKSSRQSAISSSRRNEPDSYTTSSSEGSLLPEKTAVVEDTSSRSSSSEEDLIYPWDQPEGSLTHSLCSVYSDLPDNVGLSAREALSKIQRRGLSGLNEGDEVPSVQVAKVMRSNPHFVPVSGGKFLLCRSLEALKLGRTGTTRESSENEGTGKSSCVGVFSTSKDMVSTDNGKGSPRSSELSGLNGNLGTRCTRVDGRSWQCRRTSMPGFSLCEHHHLQLSSQSRRQRNFQRAFNQSSRKRSRKGGKKGEPNAAAQEAEEGRSSIITADASRRKVVKARSLQAIVRNTVGVGSPNSTPLSI